MEKVCEYCQENFDAKRIDKLHCSPSCRQMAYIRRKLSQEIDLQGANSNPGKQETSVGASKNESETSIDGSSQTLKASIDGEKTVNTSIDIFQNVNKNMFKTSTEALSVNNETSINLSQNVKPSSDVSEKSVNSALNKVLVDGLPHKNDVVNSQKDEYTCVQSRFTAEVIDIGEENNIIFILTNFFSPSPPPKEVKWVSLRFRCLAECLLTFSEMKYVETDDLKEVCNAFTLVIQSNYFKNLPKSYPYINEIIILRDNLKKICIENNQCGEIKFRLPKSKKRLMATRWQLAYYVPKRNFNQLNFKDSNNHEGNGAK